MGRKPGRGKSAPGAKRRGKIVKAERGEVRAAPVRPDCPLTADDLDRFAHGLHDRLHRNLGAHRLDAENARGYSFAVWAPNAARVSVVGSFNDWNAGNHPLQPQGFSGIWWGWIERVEPGALYKFHIESKHNDYRADKADPFAFHAEQSPGSASIVCDLEYGWGDTEWMAQRAARSADDAPISIYEVHLGSWRRSPDDPGRLPTYRELGDELIPYLERMNFTHVEFLPPMEHPFYGSWGYQTTGYFAPTSRYGEPRDLMELIDRLHRNGIGVVLDWVPSHFPGDEFGIGFFDGTHLFEHPDPRMGFHPDWNSLVFNYGSNQVCSFLISSALFWLERYHVDAIRVDAVASMLYLDYSRADGEWVANKYGGRENLEAVGFVRQLNESIHEFDPSVRTIAEESTAWPQVTRPAYLGGLGFDMKWDMGWMHDTLDYMALDPVHRKFHQQQLTFRMLYAHSERFVLPLSHDEVVHGKGSLIERMHGDYWQKFANLRTLYGYMYGQPGKKLIFMGAEIGQWQEWDHERGLDWALPDYPSHAGLQDWLADLNRLYREQPALHRQDFDPRGFSWIDCGDADQSVLCFTRHDDAGETLLVICHFTPVPRHNYRVGSPLVGTWRELLNSDDEKYGGGGLCNPAALSTVPIPYHGQTDSFLLTLAPLSVTFLKLESAERGLPPDSPEAES